MTGQAISSNEAVEAQQILWIIKVRAQNAWLFTEDHCHRCEYRTIAGPTIADDAT